jgi:hypothetical protein
MSKAMYALKALYEDAVKAYALLRDYITTTEAERAAKEACGVVPCPECGGDGADHEDSSENCWNCNGDGVVRDTRNPMSASDESAARIKELEEALGVARNLLTDVRDAIKKLPATDGRVIGLGQFIPLINAQVEKTIGGRG